MNSIHSYLLSKFLPLQAKAFGDVGVDVTGAPGKLSVEGAGSAQVGVAVPCCAESNTGAPFFNFPEPPQRYLLSL
jgi:hypothetical protein